VLLTEWARPVQNAGTAAAAFDRALYGKARLLFFARSGGSLYRSSRGRNIWRGGIRFEFWATATSSIARPPLDFCITTFAALGDCGEKRTLYVKNNGGEAAELVVACYFEPALSPEAAYAAHPAFIRLSMETKYKNGHVIVSRRAGGRNKPYSMALACGGALQYDTDKAAHWAGRLRALRALTGRRLHRRPSRACALLSFL
jgi:hypothetical protein